MSLGLLRVPTIFRLSESAASCAAHAWAPVRPGDKGGRCVRDPVDSNHDAPQMARPRKICDQLATPRAEPFPRPRPPRRCLRAAGQVSALGHWVRARQEHLQRMAAERSTAMRAQAQAQALVKGAASARV